MTNTFERIVSSNGFSYGFVEFQGTVKLALSIDTCEEIYTRLSSEEFGRFEFVSLDGARWIVFYDRAGVLFTRRGRNATTYATVWHLPIDEVNELHDMVQAVVVLEGAA